MPAQNVGVNSTFEQQRQGVNIIAEDIFYLSSRFVGLGSDLSVEYAATSGGATVANTVADNKILQDEKMDRTEQIRNIGEVLNIFQKTLKNDRDVKIFTHRVASEVFENDKLTTVELASEFNVSKQRIAQIEKGMTQKLRKALQTCAVAAVN